MKTSSVFLPSGLIIHKSVLDKVWVAGYSRGRKQLRGWFTHCEQDEIIHAACEKHGNPDDHTFWERVGKVYKK